MLCLKAYVGYRIDRRAQNPQDGSLSELNRLALRPMRYFFHLQNGKRISDTEGNEFPDDNAAMVEATIVAKELGRHRSDAVAWRLVVTNLAGERVGQVALSTGLRLAP